MKFYMPLKLLLQWYQVWLCNPVTKIVDCVFCIYFSEFSVYTGGNVLSPVLWCIYSGLAQTSKTVVMHGYQRLLMIYISWHIPVSGKKMFGVLFFGIKQISVSWLI